MSSMSLALQAAPSGGLDATSIVVLALLAGAVVLVWWASRPSTAARYAARRPAPDAAAPAAGTVPSAPPVSGAAPSGAAVARGESFHADR